MVYISLMIRDVSTWVPSYVTISHFYVFFGKISIQSSLSIFLNWVIWYLLLSGRSSLYILDINCLWDTCFASIFPIP